MTEQKVKKRGWVKNAAIIFLSIMLILTFFSNTFMNRSLPEVAAEYVTSGSINAKIRGNGTVAANENYEVKTEQSRNVVSVPVKVGDEVKLGDILINFADADSEELKAAQTALDDAIFAYKTALIDAGGDAYGQLNRKIEKAQQDLNKAKAQREANAYSSADLAVAQKNVNTAKMEVDLQQSRVDSLQEQLSNMTPGTDNSAEISKAKAEYDAAMLIHGTSYDNMKTCARAWMTEKKETDYSKIEAYMSALSTNFKAWAGSSSFEDTKPSWWSNVPLSIAYTSDNLKAMATAFDTVNPLKSHYEALLNSSAGDQNYNVVKAQLKEARDRLAILNNTYSTYKLTLSAIEEKKTNYDAADTQVDAKQTELENLLQQLADQQKADGKEQLSLTKLKSDVDSKSKALTDLKAGGEGAIVKSQVNGKVASVSISAGNNASPDQALMVIEVPDKGYGLNFSVTTEQSKKVKVGDTAEIQNFFGGNQITATLAGIKTDPENPGTHKLLCFKLDGEVESGAQLSISIGERGGNYDTLVKNSAIRSDNNGTFVLAVVAKSSPLGNRYVAQRIDVKVLASDDVNTAVSGAISYNEFVITTSSKPIEPGMLVRLPD